MCGNQANIVLLFPWGSARYGRFEYYCGGPYMDFEGYCVKCRKKQQIKGGVVEETAKGRKMVKGTCPECGTKVTRFLSNK
jgi:hypothetical protein